MVTRNSQIQDQASRLVDQLSAVVGDLDQFCQDPATTIVDRLDIKVEFRSQGKSPCGVAGSFHPENRVIVVERAASLGRVRFSLLHELAHALGYRDSEFQDWIFGLKQGGPNAEERVANTFAAELLLPTATVDQCIPKRGTIRMGRSSTLEAIASQPRGSLRAGGATSLFTWTRHSR